MAIEQPLSAPPISAAGDALSKVNQILYSLNTIKSHVNNFKQRRAERHTYTISIGASDRFYYQLQNWLVTQIRTENQRSLKARATDYSLKYMFDDTNSQSIMVDGHKITVSSEKPKTGGEIFREELLGTGGNNNPTEPRLVFIAHSLEGFEAIKAKLINIRETAQRQSKEPPRLHYQTGFYDNTSTPILPRKIESVVLADGQRERIIDDLDRFLKDEQVYIERGIPYQRGYLFYGPPGTGKTSLAKAMAGHFNLDIYYIGLGAIHSDTELLKAVSRVGEKSIVLFEDIDVFSGVKDREGDKSDHGFTLSGFLNILDGLMTPHGMIKIMTTNEKEVIDPAVLRPGRIDLVEKLDLTTDKQADHMFEAFYGQPPASPLAIQGAAPASLIEIMKNNMYEPDAAEREMRDRFQC